MKNCDNHQCNLKVPEGVMYCCSECQYAHEGNYFPDHTPECKEREVKEINEKKWP